MANGTARRVVIDNAQALADLINNFTPSQAYVTGRLRDGLHDHVKVVTQDKLNGAASPSIIARTKQFLIYKEGESGLALIDTDIKAAPETVKRCIEERGLWNVLCEVLPELKGVARVERPSTSSGLANRDTGEIYPSSGGRHTVIPVRDAADIPRFLSVLFDRSWLNGYGWGMIAGRGGPGW